MYTVDIYIYIYAGLLEIVWGIRRKGYKIIRSTMCVRKWRLNVVEDAT